MVTYVLDASAALRYLDNEDGADRVEAILKDHAHGIAHILISVVQWGEIAGVIHRRHNSTSAFQALHRLTRLGVKTIELSADQAVRAAILQKDSPFAYADAIAVMLTLQSVDATFVTADFDFKAAEELIRIEFLPAKSHSA